MGITNLYSKRKKRTELGDQSEVYQYTKLPLKFRRQVVHIWWNAIGVYQTLNAQVWRLIHKEFSKELGLFYLGSHDFQNPLEQCISFLLDESTTTDNVLDLIEFTFNHIDTSVRELLRHSPNRFKLEVSQLPDDAINELNHRFREHAIGYQYNDGQIIRVDSALIHAEVVVPSLTLLSSQQFKGAEQEFRSGHEHYRNQEYKEAIVDALKAFESTMKTICDECGWSYSKTDTAKDLIKIMLDNELVPKYLQDHLSNLRSILGNGVPTVRNKIASHGQGAQPVTVPEYLPAYVLHLTASNIVLLVEAYKLKQGILN